MNRHGTQHCRSLFYMARVGLGSLGVISEVTLQTVPAQQLLEHTFVSSMQVSCLIGTAAIVHVKLIEIVKSLEGGCSLCLTRHHATPQEVKRKHAKWLRDNRHLRYMWIPHTDAVVVVTNNPLPEGKKAPRNPANYSEAEKTAAFQRLLQVWRLARPSSHFQSAAYRHSQARSSVRPLFSQGGGVMVKVNDSNSGGQPRRRPGGGVHPYICAAAGRAAG